MAKRLSRSTIRLESCPSIQAWAAVGGKMEGEGPLADEFDFLNPDTTFGESTGLKGRRRR